MRALALAVVLILPCLARADDRLAQEFARRHPDVKNFNPAAEAIRKEIAAGELKRAEGLRLLKAARAARPDKRAGVVMPAGTGQQLTPDQAKRLVRMQRAARRRASVAASDAAGLAFVNNQVAAQQAWFARFVPHY